MDFQGYSFLIGLTLIPFSFLFFPKLYFNKRFVVPLYIIALLLGYIGWTARHQDMSKPNFYLFLICPIFSLLLLRLELFIFLRIKGREPVYPLKNWFGSADGLWWDRIFYIIYMMLSLCLPIFLLAAKYP